jgi:hypothetical protein
MTKEEIIQMANQANLPYNYVGGELMWLDKLERFAKLVAEKEREECAKMCEYYEDYAKGNENYHATLIRAREEQ